MHVYLMHEISIAKKIQFLKIKHFVCAWLRLRELYKGIMYPWIHTESLTWILTYKRFVSQVQSFKKVWFLLWSNEFWVSNDLILDHKSLRLSKNSICFHESLQIFTNLHEFLVLYTTQTLTNKPQIWIC
jgi:hypothetical protein